MFPSVYSVVGLLEERLRGKPLFNLSFCHLVQLFEAMGMMIDEENFYNFAMPLLKEIGSQLKQRYPHVPLMMFARGARSVMIRLYLSVGT